MKTQFKTDTAKQPPTNPETKIAVKQGIPDHMRRSYSIENVSKINMKPDEQRVAAGRCGCEKCFRRLFTTCTAVCCCIFIVAFIVYILLTVLSYQEPSESKKKDFKEQKNWAAIGGLVSVLLGLVGCLLMYKQNGREVRSSV